MRARARAPPVTSASVPSPGHFWRPLGGDHSDPDSRVGFHHPTRHVNATIEVLTQLVDEDDERCYSRTCDIDADVANTVTGAVLALVVDHPDTVEDHYGVQLEVSINRHAKQPTGTVWEVRRP